MYYDCFNLVFRALSENLLKCSEISFSYRIIPGSYPRETDLIKNINGCIQIEALFFKHDFNYNITIAPVLRFSYIFKVLVML